MNNLKRVLSLALSGIMLVGMMAVGAGAVNGKDFTDQDKIQNTEAVNTLVTLNVINGKDDGSHYDPEGTLTRAEMAKLIVYVLNGGKEPVMSTKATPTYTDIQGHWAEKYIEYCSNLKIVAGQGDGTFNPGGTLTGSQAAKMMLTAMNYNSDVFHFTGADWELSVNSEANKAGLYDELDGLNASEPISRDDAAQLVYNGIQAQTMERRWAQNMTDLQITENYELTGPSLFTSKFGGTSFEGVLLSTGKYTLDWNPVVSPAAAYSGTGAGKDKAVIALTKVDGYSTPTTIDRTSYTLGQIKDFKYTEDLSAYMGQSVKVLYNADKKEVYGIYAVADNNTTVINTMTSETGSIKADSIKVDGTVYDTDGLTVFVNGVKQTGTAALDSNTADNVTFIDNDGDEKLEIALVTTVAAHEVTYVGTSSFTLGAKLAGTYATVSTSQKFDDVDTYEGMKKGDIVFVTKNLFADKDKFEKAEVAEGSISGRKGVADPFDYLIDGNWVADEKVLANTAFSNGDTIKFVARGGLLYYTKVVSGAQSLTDVALLVSVQNATTLDGNATAKLLFSDGSKKTVALKNVFASDGTTSLLASGTPSIESDKVCGMLYKFSVNSSNAYTLTLAADASTMGDYTWAVNGATGYAMSNVTAAAGITTINSLDIADDAVIFLFNDKNETSAEKGGVVAASGNDAKVITGKELKNLAANKVNGEVFFYGTSVTNGLSRVAFAVVEVETTPGTKVSLSTITATSSANYGYIVSAPYTTKVDGTNYVVYPTWDGESTVNYKCKADAIVAGVAKGEVIGFDKVDGETIKSVTHIVTTADAVTGLDGKYVKFQTAPSTYTLDGDTVYLYVNSNASKSGEIGQEGGALQLSSEPDNNVFVKNVKVYAVSPTQVKLVVVDTENKMAHDTAYGVTITNTASVVESDLTLTVDGAEKAVTAPSTTCVRAGDVVKITNDHASKSLNFTATGTSTTSGTVRPGETVTLIATGAADLALTWATFA